MKNKELKALAAQLRIPTIGNLARLYRLYKQQDDMLYIKAYKKAADIQNKINELIKGGRR